MDVMQLRLADLSATRRLAACLARALATIALSEQGIAVHLSGDLGTGKTTLVRQLLANLGIGGPVKSPSYALLESYNGPSFTVYHFDLYRFSSPEQWIDAGFDEILAGPGLVLVEWPEQAAGVLPPPDLLLRLEWPADARERADASGDQAVVTAPPIDADCLGDPTEPGDGSRRLEVTALSPAGRQCLTVLERCWSDGASG